MLELHIWHSGSHGLLVAPCRGADRERILPPILQVGNGRSQPFWAAFCTPPRPLTPNLGTVHPCQEASYSIQETLVLHEARLSPGLGTQETKKGQDWASSAEGAGPAGWRLGVETPICNQGEGKMQSKSWVWSFPSGVIRESPSSRMHLPLS